MATLENIPAKIEIIAPLLKALGVTATEVAFAEGEVTGTQSLALPTLTQEYADTVWAAFQVSTAEADFIAEQNVKDLKRKTEQAILTIAPEWKQRNLIARGLELTEILATSGTLTTEQLAESDAIKAIWGQIKAIRAASDVAEANGTAAQDFNP
jgi:hypothetical protein